MQNKKHSVYPQFIMGLSLLCCSSIFVCCFGKQKQQTDLYSGLYMEKINKQDRRLLGSGLNLADSPSPQSLSSSTSGPVSKFSKVFHAIEKLELTVLKKGPGRSESIHSPVEFDIGRNIVTYIYGKNEADEGRSDNDPQEVEVSCYIESYLSGMVGGPTNYVIFGRPVRSGFEFQRLTTVAQKSKILKSKGSEVSKICERVFNKKLRKYALESLRGYERNIVVSSELESCTTNVKARRMGDNGCQKWFHKSGSYGTKNIIARCVAVDGLSGDRGICELRSDTDGFCPLFLDESMSYTGDVFHESMGLATPSSIMQLFCDEKMESVCKPMQSPQGTVVGVCRRGGL